MVKGQRHQFLRAGRERIAEAFGRKPIVSKKRTEKHIKGAEAALKELAASERIPKEERNALDKKFSDIIAESKYLPFDSRSFVLGELAKSMQGISSGALSISESKRQIAKFRIFNNLLRSTYSISGAGIASYPKSQYRFRYKRSHKFADGSVAKDVFALNVNGAGDIAVFNLRSGKPGEFVVDFIRETAGSALSRAEKLLERPWLEAVGNKFAIAQKLVIKQGFLLRMPEKIHETNPEFAKLYLSDSASENARYFNPYCKKTRELMGGLANYLPGMYPFRDKVHLTAEQLKRKPRTQRERDRLNTRERLEKRRRIKLIPETKTAEAEYTRDWHYSDYREHMGVDFKELFEGKRGLDVGCGYGNFVKEARRKGILVEGVDTAAPQGEYFHRVLFHDFKPKHKYAFITSHLSIPKYNKGAYSRRLNIYLMLKCLEPEGMLIIHPFTGDRKYARLKGNDSIAGATLRKMESLGLEIDYPERGQERIIIKKKNEKQVERLGRMLGVI